VADLVGKRLEPQAMVRCGQSAGNGLVGSLGVLCAQKNLDGFLEPTLQQVAVAVEGYEPQLPDAGLLRQVEAVNVIQEEQGANALVEVRALFAKCFQVRTLMQQILEPGRASPCIDGLVAHIGIGGCDDRDEAPGHAAS